MVKEIIEVYPGEYKLSMNENKVIHTCGLSSCVGLALIEDIGKKRKRGLAHIYWGGEKDIEESNGRLKISKPDIKRVDGFLKEFIGEFKGKPFQDIKNFGKMYSLMVFNRPFYGKTNYNENPMATHVMDWVLEHKINLMMSEGINKWEKNVIDSKELALHDDKLAVLYKNKSGRLLNYGHINENLCDFLL